MCIGEFLSYNAKIECNKILTKKVQFIFFIISDYDLLNKRLSFYMYVSVFLLLNVLFKRYVFSEKYVV